MSIARVTTVAKSMKPYVCEKCRTELPKGSEYRHYKVGFRSHYRHIRCMAAECTPRPSELESSKMSQVYSAQEDFEAALDAATCADDIRTALEEYGNAVREVGEAYREAGTDDNGTEWSPDSIERAEALESAGDEIEGIEIEDPDTECADCNGTGSTDCDACNGTGKYEDPSGTEDDCGDCQGSGETECETCGGSGETDDSDLTDEQLDGLRDAARAALEVELP